MYNLRIQIVMYEADKLLIWINIMSKIKVRLK
jgi:hypothetical protein